MKTILLLIGSLTVYSSFAQTKATPFSMIDKRVKKIQASAPDTLALKLTAPCKSETEKVRAIFKWITENIAYDTKAYHNLKNIYEGLWRPAISSIDSVVRKDYNDRIVQKVLNERKAICDGYSRLFKTLCDYAKIKSVIITGFIRWSSDPIGVATKREHAWNAVFINNSWRLLDATWASGYCNAEVTEFTKFYNDFFFFTNPIHFFNDHYPADNKWSLLPNTPGLDQFYNFPFYYPDFYKYKILSLSPVNGNIELTMRNRTVTIEIETNNVVKSIYVYESPYIPDSIRAGAMIDSLSEKEANDLYKPEYRIINKKITYKYEVKSEKAGKLNVVLNDDLILTYEIKMRK